MSQYTFPAIFLWDDNENYYDVTFPDMENCFTAGENLPEALSNAADALALILCDKEDQRAIDRTVALDIFRAYDEYYPDPAVGDGENARPDRRAGAAIIQKKWRLQAEADAATTVAELAAISWS